LPRLELDHEERIQEDNEVESGAIRRWMHVNKKIAMPKQIRAVNVPSTQGASPGYLKFANPRRWYRLSGKRSRF